MKATLAVINRLEQAGIIRRYAIGGAVGAIYYLEAMSTEDIDIFVSISQPKDSLIVTLQPIYDFLQGLGYTFQGEYIAIEGWPVQFLPADHGLYNEALLSALVVDYDGVQTRVMRQEHLMAIALQTGRFKDFDRLERFLNLNSYDKGLFDAICLKHNLSRKWDLYQKRRNE